MYSNASFHLFVKGTNEQQKTTIFIHSFVKMKFIKKLFSIIYNSTYPPTCLGKVSLVYYIQNSRVVTYGSIVYSKYDVYSLKFKLLALL